MTGESYNRTPVGRIVVRGEPIVQTEKILVEAATAGMLVTCDNNDYKAKKAAAGTEPVGWVGFEHTDVKVRPSNYETPYVSGNAITVIAGGNFEIVALASGEPSTGSNITIKSGDMLASNGDGTLKPVGTSGARAIAIAQETVTIAKSTTSTPNTARIGVLSLI